MLLSLPMAQAIRSACPEWQVAVLASAANREAAEHNPDVDQVLVDIEAKHSGLRDVGPLARALRGRFDAAVLVHPTPRLALALWLARIPVRVGTAYRSYSFLLNRRLPQHRRGRPVHEATLNLELLAGLGIAPPKDIPPLKWRFDPSEREKANALLRREGLLDSRWAVIHPGNAGSAMNWDVNSYAAFGSRLVQAGWKVALTGTATEQQLVQHVCAKVGRNVANLCGRLSLGELAAVLASAHLFVGGSTGPTHLAALLGTPTVAVYAPLRSQRPERWRPLGPHVVTLLPEVHQQCPRCILQRCPYYPCMTRRLPVDLVWHAAESLVARAPQRETAHS